MIIKNYNAPVMHDTTHAPDALDVQIIDGCTDVYVHSKLFDEDARGPNDFMIEKFMYGQNSFTAEQMACIGSTSNGPRPQIRFIDFTRNGLRNRLGIYRHAYICNDEGRTVEKVSV